MNPLRRLAGQTAIYGLSSILGRVIGYLLIPLYTRVFIPEEYGVANEMYAYCSILLILLTYGMETTFFRFSESESDRERVYSTSLISILVTTLLFLILAFGFSGPLAELIRHPDHREYIIWFALIVSMDALTAIPFARLRAAGKATRFAAIKLLNIFFFIGFNLFFIVLCPYLLQKGLFTEFVNMVYNENIGVGYIFISNLIASAITILLLLPEYLKTKFRFDRALWRRMMVYALPLLVLGLAGSINETMDRIFLKFMLPENIAMEQVGIYGACYKISLIMTIFIQAFRFAAEPFFFAHAREADARKTYADVMKYFVIVCTLIFLAVMMYMDGVKYFVGEKYYAGLTIVPILLLANLFLGVYFNLSIWYKLTNQTKFGAFISIGGALLTVLLNIWWIPLIGFMGSAWATLICYFAMMVVSYVIGQKHYAVPYDLRSIICYVLAAVALFLFSQWLFPGYASGHGSLKLIVNSALLLSFILVVGYFEKPLVRSIFKLRRS